MPRGPSVRFLLIVLTVWAADGAAQTQQVADLRFDLFTAVDRRAVRVGEEVALDVEALAVVSREAQADALVEAVARLSVDDADWEAVRLGPVQVRRTGHVLEVQRRLVLRPSRAGLDAAPVVALTVLLDGERRSVRARPQSVWVDAPSRAVDRAAGSVVRIVAERPFGATTLRRVASAFVVGDTALVTAYHAVAGARRVRVEWPNGRRSTVRHAWALDPARDLAVLDPGTRAVRRGGARSLPLDDDDPDAADAAVYAASHARPVRSGRRHADVAVGAQRLIVAALAVQRGDSGGPLLDAQGRVLGVVVSGRSAGASADLLGADICLAAALDAADPLWSAARAPTPLRAALAAARSASSIARAIDQADEVLAAGLLPGASPQDAAEALADEALRAPDDPLLQFLAGATLDEAGLYAAPARLALRAAWMDGYLPAAYTLAYHHLRGGDTREAARLFGEVRTEEPYAALGAYGLAQARVAAGAYREAGPLLGEVLHHDARFAPALYLLGLVRLAEGRTDEAEALRVRLAVAPSWAAALDFAIRHPAFRPEGVRPLPRGTLAAAERLRIVYRDSVNAPD